MTTPHVFPARTADKRRAHSTRCARLLPLIAMMIALAPMTHASASPILVEVPDTVIVGSTTESVSGTFDVTLNLTDSGDAPSVAGYGIRLDVVPAGEGLSFTGASEADNALFLGRTPQVFATGDFLRAGDSLPGIGEENEVEPGMGLLRVAFEIGVGVFGDFDITVHSGETNFTAGDGSDLDVDTTSIGTISVVPEPGSAALLGVGAMLLLCRGRGRHGREGAATAL